MLDLPQCKLHHFAAFVEDLKAIFVWDDEVGHLLQRAEELKTGFDQTKRRTTTTTPKGSARTPFIMRRRDPSTSILWRKKVWRKGWSR